jgi:tripartite ATP-independent transporter DctP family solute receptor
MSFAKACLAAFAAIALSAIEAAAQKVELKLGHIGEPGSLYAQTAEEFAKRANAKLGDKAHVEIYGSSQLGSDKDLLQKLKLGQVQLWLASTIMSSVAPEFGVFEMPYIIKDRAHMRRVAAAMDAKVFGPAAKAKGVLLLGTCENGFRHITNNLRPISKPADLAGIKLRVPQGEWRVKMFSAYGANPTPLAYGEVFTALKTGVMDGQENPLPQIWAGKFNEVQKYLSLSGHVYTPLWIAASPDGFAKLAPEVQTALKDAAKETEGVCLDLGAKLDDELLSKMKASGNLQVNDVDKAAFIAASKGVYDEFDKAVKGGGQLIKDIMALAN